MLVFAVYYGFVLPERLRAKGVALHHLNLQRLPVSPSGSLISQYFPDIEQNLIEIGKVSARAVNLSNND